MPPTVLGYVPFPVIMVRARLEGAETTRIEYNPKVNFSDTKHITQLTKHKI